MYGGKIGGRNLGLEQPNQIDIVANIANRKRHTVLLRLSTYQRVPSFGEPSVNDATVPECTVSPTRVESLIGSPIFPSRQYNFCWAQRFIRLSRMESAEPQKSATMDVTPLEIAKVGDATLAVRLSDPAPTHSINFKLWVLAHVNFSPQATFRLHIRLVTFFFFHSRSFHSPSSLGVITTR